MIFESFIFVLKKKITISVQHTLLSCFENEMNTGWFLFYTEKLVPPAGCTFLLLSTNLKISMRHPFPIGIFAEFFIT